MKFIGNLRRLGLLSILGAWLYVVSKLGSSRGCADVTRGAATRDARRLQGRHTGDVTMHLMTSSEDVDLWTPSPRTDRIMEQLQHVPAHVRANPKGVKVKVIGIFGNVLGSELGQKEFLKQNCPVHQCEIRKIQTTSKRLKEADAVLFYNSRPMRSLRRYSHQIWISFTLESPVHMSFNTWGDDDAAASPSHAVNWTATYRHDSTIVTPYRKWLPDYSNRSRTSLRRNYAKGKTKKVAWFVSNCGAQNNRMEYAHELRRYISVDIYGRCGQHRCKHGNQTCFNMLKTDYKFYLSFENSNCWEYITEKFFHNALSNDVIPVAMGARPIDYQRVAPPHSYIHVSDFRSPRHLAEYLHKLDRNDTLYNEYFEWKERGRFVNTKFWCRVCALLHAAETAPPRWVRDLGYWWEREEVCEHRDGRRKDSHKHRGRHNGGTNTP